MKSAAMREYDGELVPNTSNPYQWPYQVPGTQLPTDSAERKNLPIATGFLDYFPDAIADVARLSKLGNDKHNPGQPLHWNRSLSADHADCLMRHFVERGKVDTDRVRHSTKVAWRALAILQLELEAARGVPPERPIGPDDLRFSTDERLVTVQAHDDLHTEYDDRGFGEGQL